MRASTLSAPLWTWLVAAFALSTAFVSPARTSQGAEARLVSVQGIIDAVTARYLERELGRAEADGATLVIVRINTPGGLDAPMRAMTSALLGARVPTVTYVSPSGARAASAGMFVVIAANLGAMAPGTEIGAAHPVVLGGRADPVMEEKLLNDAA